MRKHILIDGTKYRVFGVIPQSHGQLQVNVGMSMPESAHTLPAHWFRNPGSCRCKTGGHTYSLEGCD